MPFQFLKKADPAQVTSFIQEEHPQTIALIIAFTKMFAIMLFFMHVKYSSSLVKVLAGISFAFMIIFFAFTFADFVPRKNHFHSTFVPDPYGGTPTAAQTR